MNDNITIFTCRLNNQLKFFLSFDKPFRYFPYFLLFVAAILFLLRFDLTIAYPILFGVWVGTGAGLAVASSNFKSSIKLLSSFDDIKTVALLCRLLALPHFGCSKRALDARHIGLGVVTDQSWHVRTSGA